MSSQTVLVIRATATQGIAVLKNLQKNNIKARAYVTNAKDDRAIALRALGAELFEGTLGDAKALEVALTGCTGLFLNQMPSFQDDTESQHAKIVLETARKNGVKHVIHSTSLGVPRAEILQKAGAPVAAAVVGKSKVEALVQNSGIDYWTIIRGGYFMSNFLGFGSRFMFPELAKEKKFVCSYKPDTPLPLIDPYDIGAFAAAAYLQPDKFHGEIIKLSVENELVDQVVKDLAQAVGQPIEAVYRTDAETDELSKTNPMIAGAKWMLDLYKEGDIESARKYGVPLHSFPEFLARESDLVNETFHGDRDFSTKSPF